MNLPLYHRLFLEKIAKKEYYITIMTNPDAILAAGKNYFASDECPIAVRIIRDSGLPQHEKDYTLLPHLHDFAELVIVTGGSGTQVVNGIEYPVSPGDVFLLQGYCEHFFREESAVEMINVIFDPGRLPLPRRFFGKLPGYQVIFRLEPSLRNRRNFKHRLHLDQAGLAASESMARRLASELGEREAGFEAAALGILIELITFVSRHHASQHAGNRAALVRLGEVISRLERDFTGRWTLARIARAAGTSPNNLLRLFRQATGDTPIDYLVKLRLRRGAELLADRRHSIAEVAEAAGFRDSNYFAKKFRVLYGMSPREYRRTLP